MPQNGVKYAKTFCKQQLDFFQIHGGERGSGVGSKSEAITQLWVLLQDHVASFNSYNEEQYILVSDSC